MTEPGAGRREAERTEARDGRNIDPEIGALEGEASQQAVPSDRATVEGAVPYSVWGREPTQRPDGATYYDRPAIKEPVWIWAVPAYFYVGGAGGAAAVLGAVAQAADRQGFARLIERCRWIAAAGTASGTALLIYDLGRPARFLNMLRVFRPTSPLNVGSWILAAAGPLAAGSAAFAGSDGPVRRLGDLAGAGAGLLGGPLAAYTAVLVTNTAVPVWQAPRRTLPVLFVSSAASSAASLLELEELDERAHRVVERFGRLAKLVDLAATVAVEREAGRVDRVAQPLKEGLAGALWRAAKALTASSLMLSVLPGSSRAKRVSSGVLGTAGAVALRFAVWHAGTMSARDPRATFEMQRAGHGAAEVTGQVAASGSRGSRAV
ncbi:MAG TPA: NrfD/PsrC family molybdoenzyme membrane anchor subunit [Actinomycetota bacterium]|nr:NrfD/PsrC family molybdoenzyme membrane anchor subunit [Actinomycetota bacterium]